MSAHVARSPSTSLPAMRLLLSPHIADVALPPFSPCRIPCECLLEILRNDEILIKIEE